MSEKFQQKIIDAGGQLKVRSALNPALWFCAIIFLPTMAAIAKHEGDPPWYLLMLLFVPVLIVAFGFLFLLFFDRDKLQSEDYQIRKQSLDLVYQKGQPPSYPSINLEASSDPLTITSGDVK